MHSNVSAAASSLPSAFPGALRLFPALAGRMAGMEDRGKKSGWSAMVFAVIGLLVLLPALYVLSSGSATWLVFHDYLSPGFTQYWDTPLRWAGESCEPVGDILGWYENLFIPELPII